MSVCLSVFPSIHPSIHPPTYLPISLSYLFGSVSWSAMTNEVIMKGLEEVLWKPCRMEHRNEYGHDP